MKTAHAAMIRRCIHNARNLCGLAEDLGHAVSDGYATEAGALGLIATTHGILHANMGRKERAVFEQVLERIGQGHVDSIIDNLVDSFIQDAQQQ